MTEPVQVSRRINAPAPEIFAVLCNPDRHPELDGSGMLRAGASNSVVEGVGDVFLMKMFFESMGDYEMANHVVEFEPNRRISWEPRMPGATQAVDDPTRNGSRWSFELSPDGPDATTVTEGYDSSGSPDTVREAVDSGRAWIGAMTATLERLDQVCTSS